MQYNLKHYAHIGDAVWELFIRECIIPHALSQRALHNLTTKFVNADFQSSIFLNFEDFFSADEAEIARRARNLPISIAKRNNPQTHRNATALEAVVGFWYLNDKSRLFEFFENVKKYLKFD